MTIYLDSSAIAKLILEEDESAAMRQFLAPRSRRYSSLLALAEVTRAANRIHATEGVAKARDALSKISLVTLDIAVLERASLLQPAGLRTLDAIHLASALSLPELHGMVVYDRRLAAAAADHGLTVFAPGQA